MKQTYRVLAGLVALGVLVQAAAIAAGWFTVINEVDSGDLVVNSDYEGNGFHALHGMNGMMVMPLLGLLLLISSFFAKIPGGIKWAGTVFGLIVLQVVLGIMAFSLPAVGALHGINALLIFGAAVIAARRVPAAVATTVDVTATETTVPPRTAAV